MLSPAHYTCSTANTLARVECKRRLLLELRRLILLEVVLELLHSLLCLVFELLGVERALLPILRAGRLKSLFLGLELRLFHLVVSAGQYLHR